MLMVVSVVTKTKNEDVNSRSQTGSLPMEADLHFGITRKSGGNIAGPSQVHISFPYKVSAPLEITY